MVTHRPEAIDTRLVYRVYAWLGVVSVMLFFLVGIGWIADASRVPGGPAATFGMAGAAVCILTAYAIAFARVDDPAARAGGLKVFAIAHLAAGGFLWALFRHFEDAFRRLPVNPLDPNAFLGWLPYRLIATALFVNAAVLAYLACTATPGPRFSMIRRREPATGDPALETVIREKEGPASVRRLRSEYEQQIRQAARREERARLARDLHDAVKQQLFVIQTAAATMEARFESDRAGAQAALGQVRTAAREALTEMSAMLDQLQAAPAENVGLVEALKRQCEALGFRSGAEVSFDVQPLPAAHLLPAGAHEAIHRVAQEALANIGRHARARHVTVRLDAGGRDVTLRVADDGAGFDPLAAAGGMGLQNIQARAIEVGGRLEITSRPGEGTTISFSVPLTADAPRRYLAIAAAFAAVFFVVTVLLVQARAGMQTFFQGGAWAWGYAAAVIAAIGTLRYAAAYVWARRAYRGGA